MTPEHAKAEVLGSLRGCSDAEFAAVADAVEEAVATARHERATAALKPGFAVRVRIAEDRFIAAIVVGRRRNGHVDVRAADGRGTLWSVPPDAVVVAR